MIPNHDDRMWAMLSHLLVFLGVPFPLVGAFVPPLVIYIVRREQSRFVAFHALQSLYFQAMMWLVYMFIGAIGWVVAIATLGMGYLPVAAFVGFIYFVSVLYIIWAGIKANNGDVFEYFIVGPIARATVGI